MGKKKYHPQGDPNPNRRNGKAFKKRPCGQRHAITISCQPCSAKAQALELAIVARRRKKAAAREGLKTAKHAVKAVVSKLSNTEAMAQNQGQFRSSSTT